MCVIGGCFADIQEKSPRVFIFTGKQAPKGWFGLCQLSDQLHALRVGLAHYG